MAPELPFAHYREALAEIRLTCNYLIRIAWGQSLCVQRGTAFIKSARDHALKGTKTEKIHNFGVKWKQFTSKNLRSTSVLIRQKLAVACAISRF